MKVITNLENFKSYLEERENPLYDGAIALALTLFQEIAPLSPTLKDKDGNSRAIFILEDKKDFKALTKIKDWPWSAYNDEEFWENVPAEYTQHYQGEKDSFCLSLYIVSDYGDGIYLIFNDKTLKEVYSDTLAESLFSSEGFSEEMNADNFTEFIDSLPIKGTFDEYLSEMGVG